jgi:hypothetical protein
MAREIKLVVGAEVWVPEGDLMVFRSGSYGYQPALADISRRSQFRPGEGLPGAVRATAQTQLWKDLNARFLRPEQATAAGIDAALGIPWFRGNTLVAVVAIHLSQRTEVPGCLEIWRVNEALDVLTHAGGYYSHCPEFEHMGALVQFQKGTGLPGKTRASKEVEVIEDVRESTSFLRSSLASRAGLKFGIGIPVCRFGDVPEVITLFGSSERPFVHSFWRFMPGEAGWLDPCTPLVADPALDLPSPSHGARLKALAEAALESGVPGAYSGQRDGSPADTGLTLVLPCDSGTGIKSVVCLEV